MSNGVARHWRRWTEVEITRMRELLTGGVTKRAVAVRCGVSDKALSNALKKAEQQTQENAR